jgi:hypothetical protein
LRTQVNPAISLLYIRKYSDPPREEVCCDASLLLSSYRGLAATAPRFAVAQE